MAFIFLKKLKKSQFLPHGKSFAPLIVLLKTRIRKENKRYEL
ncbi:hypothetical protein M107_1162 [Bacteroides fragilis str. 3725 D9(v)]|nr:hypothetical protein M100_1203 [Bacteroides fragilis str. 1007-1-F \